MAALPLVIIVQSSSLREIIIALIIGIVTVAAPFFIMQPAMGAGFASSKAEKPNVARARSLAAHAAFGLGLYLSAVVAASLA